MPCDDGGPSHEQVQQDRIDKLARMLCFVCEKVEQHTMQGKYLNAEIMTWWEDHKRRDAMRKADEQKRLDHQRKAKAARDKLTVEERELLGVR